jgi:hypothetical protein
MSTGKVKGGKSEQQKMFKIIFKLFCNRFSLFFADIMLPKILLPVSRLNREVGFEGFFWESE